MTKAEHGAIRAGLVVGIFLGLAGCGSVTTQGQPGTCYYTGTEVVCATTLDKCIVEGYRSTGRHECDMVELVIASDGVTAEYRLGSDVGSWSRLDTNIVLDSAITGAETLLPLKEGN